MNENEPQSPCISVCRLNMESICQGCFRSADEIADWLLVGAAQKRDILRRASERRKAATNAKPR